MMKIRKLAALILFSALHSEPSRAADFLVTQLGSAGTGTLRQAILIANTSPSAPHRITFNLPSPFRIVLTNALPAVTNVVLIDGVTQPGYTGTPIVNLTATNDSVVNGLVFRGPGGGVQALQIFGFSNSTALILQGFSNRVSASRITSNLVGISVQSNGFATVIGGTAMSNRNSITGNEFAGIFLGGTGDLLRVIGNDIVSNIFYGIYISGAYATVGGPTPAQRNIISRNGTGIYMEWTNARNNQIINNFIGLDATGTNAAGNVRGIDLFNAPDNRVTDGNYISGNNLEGILIRGYRATNNLIEGNFIGLATNQMPLGNAFLFADAAAILMEDVEANYIFGNVISGNRQDGLLLTGTNTRNNQVLGNLIGLNSSGTFPVSNGLHGIHLANGAVSNVVGRSDFILYRNVIARHGGSGVHVASGARGTFIGHNLIGTDISGNLPMGGVAGITISNALDTVIASNLISGNITGIALLGVSNRGTRIDFNWIGVNNAGTGMLNNTANGIHVAAGSNTLIGVQGRNIISGNQQNGVLVDGTAWDVTVANNFIGVGTNGIQNIRNLFHGVAVRTSGQQIFITNNTIAGNNSSGIHVFGPGVSNTWIAGNRIGVGADGATPVANAANGIYVQEAGHVLIGGTSAANRNIVSGNMEHGILLNFASNGPVVIAGNAIGVNGTGLAIISNRGCGVLAQFSRGIQIGGPSAAWRNWISGNSNAVKLLNVHNAVVSHNYIGLNAVGSSAMGNRAAGIFLTGGATQTNEVSNNIIVGSGGAGIRIESDVRRTTIRANRIGVGLINTQAFPNAGPGIFVDGSERITYGGTNAGDGNRIAYNLGPGIAITSVLFGLRMNHEILGNLIYSNASIPIDLNADGVTTNDPTPDDDAGRANNFPNFPVLQAAARGSTVVYGRLESKPLWTYRIEFFGSDPSNGMVFLGATNLTLDGSGTGVFKYVFTPNLATGALVFATATTTNEGTSEFSAPVVLSENVDSDGDGMPNWWETLFGLSPAISNAPTADADGDETPDLHEWIADTAPSNPESFPRIVHFNRLTNWIVTLESSSLRRYGLESAASPADTVWSTVITNRPGIDGLLSLTNNAPDTTRVFRATIRLPPP